jgi:ankyrin repeat protein
MDVMVRDQDGFTPLHAAAHYGQPDVVAALLKNGADPDVITAYGVTPLHLGAILSGSPAILSGTART